MYTQWKAQKRGSCRNSKEALNAPLGPPCRRRCGRCLTTKPRKHCWGALLSKLQSFFELDHRLLILLAPLGSKLGSQAGSSGHGYSVLVTGPLPVLCFVSIVLYFVCVCVDVWRPKKKAECPPSPLASLSPETGSLTEPSTGRRRADPCNSPGSTLITLKFFSWVQGVPPQSSGFHSRHADILSHFVSPFPVLYDMEPLTSTGQLFCELSPTLALSNVF